VKDALSSFDAFILTTLALPARKKGEPSPAKKAKKSSAKQSSATGSRKKKSLSLLPAMPLDILFEVRTMDLIVSTHHTRR